MKHFMFLSVLALLSAPLSEYADDQSDEKMINEFINSGHTHAICFDSSNIKQFWVDNSVISKNNSIQICFPNRNASSAESNSFKLQLANVDERMDCKIDVFTKDEGLKFSVINSQNKVLSSSSVEQNFIGYHILSSKIHMEEAYNNMFFLKFFSDKENETLIKKIVLTFSDNKNCSFLFSPGTINVSPDDVALPSPSGPLLPMPNYDAELDKDSFILKGMYYSLLYVNKRIKVSNLPLKTTVTIKNVGDNQLTIHVGFATFSSNGDLLLLQHYPYKTDSKALKILSFDADKREIIVDSYPKWEKYCHIALNAKDDFSDVPNLDLLLGTVSNVEELENGHAKITMNLPIYEAAKLNVGDKIRIHGTRLAYIYPNSRRLNPGEEFVFTSSIGRDDSVFQYTTKTLAHGVCSVLPVIVSISANADEANSIQISDYSIEY